MNKKSLVVVCLGFVLILLQGVTSMNYEIDSNTKLLLHFDEGFSDASSSGHSVTPKGNAKLSSSEKQFGTGSAYFDGTDDYLSLTAGSGSDFDFGTGDFTIELWVYPTGYYGYTYALLGSDGAAPGIELNFEANTGIQQTYFVWGASSSASWPPNLFWRTSYVGNLANSWHHVAMVRSGSTFILFLDGTQVDTVTSSGTIGYPGTYWIGEGYGGSYVEDLKGYIDEYRISKGIARWTSDFSNDLPVREYGDIPKPSCQSTCSPEGKKECSPTSNGYDLCTDTNNDGCVEWKFVACGTGEKCEDGACVDETICTNDCSTLGVTECLGNGVRTCNNLNGCLKLSGVILCLSNEICSEGACVERQINCVDECSIGESPRCSLTSNGYEVCSNTDEDGCTDEWVLYACNSDEECIGGQCIEVGCVPETKEETCGDWICGIKTNNCEIEISCGEECSGGICSEGKCVSLELCKGCEYKSTCVDYGFRVSNSEINLGTSSYCSADKVFINQKENEGLCQNNFECLSNQCSDGVCVGLVEEIRAQTSLLWRILCTLLNPISSEERQSCMDEHSITSIGN